MKQNLRFTVFAVLTLSVLILNACGSTAPAANLPAGGSDKSPSAAVEFTGKIEAMDGNQWIVNGQPLVVDAQALGGAPAFKVGDTVHVKGTVAQDETITVSGLQSPDAQSAQGGAPVAADGKAPVAQPAQGLAPVAAGGATSADPSATPEPTASPAPSGQQELVGVVDAINGSEITIDGVTYTLGNGVTLPANLAVGDTVKIHFTDVGGVLTITDIQTGSGNGGSGSGGGSDDDDNDDDDDDDDD